MPGYPDEVLPPMSVAECEACITAIDFAHHHGGFRSLQQAQVARGLRRRLRSEVALAVLAAAGVNV